MTKIIKPRWIRESEIRKQPVPVKPLPDWVDRFKYQPPEKLTHTHAVMWAEPEDVNCPSGLKAWPPGYHTFGGELIPCAWCGCLHNMFNFGREYYPQQFDDHPRHDAFERHPEDRRGEVTADSIKIGFHIHKPLPQDKD